MNQQITFSKTDQLPIDHFVNCIKSVRALTGMGLKESKAIIDEFRNGHTGSTTVNLAIAPNDLMSNIEILRRDGIIATVVGEVQQSTEHHISTAAQQALQEGNYKMASELAAILRRNYTQ